MLDEITQALSVDLKALTSVAVVIIIAILFYALSRRGVVLLGSRGALAEPVVNTLRIFLRWAFLGLTILIVLQILGVLDNVWAALVAVMAMVAIGFFAVWSVLSNALCTLLILIYKPFRIGEQVELPADNLCGKAIDLNLIYTTLMDGEGNLIQVPNNTFFQKPIRRKPGQSTISLYEQLKRQDPSNQP